MKRTMLPRLAALSFALAFSGAAAAQPCGLCSTEVVLTPGLAECFLSEYSDLAAAGDAAVMVNLAGCERGVVEAIPGPSSARAGERPDTQFMLSRAQLDCLKQKLEDPALVLDPSARIGLDAC